ncbi:hypothetical protein GUITHDRAFT_99846 [Guillardia theta CCMP2712]|uniref:Enoyl-CoA hydratase domain-containing protein 3, mitochondrial n=1 Tax=Guillardia theta (strain CCMP2712) TaxID=905079 RepID=L1K1D8_GUITC|nr:hypothetical protein GUITHDRAFT_99846 [Guillardia theta CCMP2712]EKX54364.1 hypothetical protein GUITHDRAFT_99846 [Guillardia theta CCMP2712]|eukprot:XP_005841344.1 hypothetical protein GUITHDRAFT_99846 [Guillardia theta CCMP2712]
MLARQGFGRVARELGRRRMSTGEEKILSEVKEGVAFLTLNDNSKRNALSFSLMTELRDKIQSFEEDRSVKVAVLRHAGKVFSSGHDLKELSMLQKTVGSTEKVFAACSDLMLAIRKVRYPVIAEVSGLATAGGCQLVAACDLAVASEEATFSTPGVKIGLFCTTPGVAIARSMHAKHAMSMLLTGDMLTAEQALSYGLVNQVTTPHALQATTESLAMKIAAAPSETISIGKAAFYKQASMEDLVAAYEYGKGVMVNNMKIADAEEGIGAFIEKRKPVWKT